MTINTICMVITWKEGSLTSVCGESTDFQIESELFGIPVRIDLCEEHYEIYKEKKIDSEATGQYD